MRNTVIRLLLSLAIALSVTGGASNAFAECQMRNCGPESKYPGDCERARAAYHSCVRAEQAAWEAERRAEQARREAAERESLRKAEEARRAVQQGTSAPRQGDPRVYQGGSRSH
jgi:hypothetical protein